MKPLHEKEVSFASKQPFFSWMSRIYDQIESDIL